jgi:hypothetical protein
MFNDAAIDPPVDYAAALHPVPLLDDTNMLTCPIYENYAKPRDISRDTYPSSASENAKSFTAFAA